MVILGGMGNLWGVAAGAFIVYMIQVVVLKQLNSISEALAIPIISEINFTDYQFLLLGVALVLMMLVRPEGLFPSQRRRRELHVADEFGDDPAIVGAMGEAPDASELLHDPAGSDGHGTTR